MKTKIAAILVILIFLGGLVSADEVRLSNGDRLTGTVVELGEEILRMDTASGEIIIPRNRVAAAFLGEKNPSDASPGKKAGEMHAKNPIPAHEPDTTGDGMLEE